jgi:hypothetical protein
MSPDTIKLISPLVFVLLWMNFARRQPKILLVGAALFFTSIVAFSQNFTFFYRELHQLSLSGLVLLYLLKFGRIYKINYFFGFVVLFVGNSAIFSDFDSDAEAQIINLIVVMGVTNYLYIAISSYERLQLVINFIGQLAFASACIGLLEFLIFGSLRIEGTFSNSNYFAFFLGIGYCAYFDASFRPRKALALTTIVLAIFLSGSRAALFFPLFHFLWYVYRRKEKNSSGFYFIVGFVFVAIVASLGLSRFADREASEGSDAERLIFAVVAYRMVSDHPLVGVGWGRYISEFSNYSSEAEQILTSSGEVDVSNQERRVTHNDYLRVLAELGWVAFVFSITFIGVGFRKILGKRFYSPLYMFPIWFGSLIFSLTHNNLNSALFWFILLMPYFYLRSMDDKSIVT